MISALQFRTAAQEFSKTCLCQGSSCYKWTWVTSNSIFAASLGGGYLATPTIPVSVINMHRDTTAESAVHDPAPACKGSRALSTSVNAVIGSGPSSLDPTPETTNTSVESHWLQASRSHTMHSNEDDGHDACTADSSSLAVCFYQYHIVYLPSYSVPVLLFKAYNEDGSQLKREDIVANLPEAYQHIAQQQDAAWTFISQIEHPHLNSPWYMLHPCQTSELLGLMLHSKETASAAQNSLSSDSGLQYMTAWFSLVGPPLCLHLDDVMLV